MNYNKTMNTSIEPIEPIATESVSCEIDRLMNDITILSERIGALHTRLNMVLDMRDQKPSVCGNAPVREPPCALMGALGNLSNSIRIESGRIQELIERIML